MRGVADKAGNKAQGTTTWSFSVADFGASAASVHVTGLLLNVSASSLNNAALTAIKADLATLLGVADTRFTNLEISNIWIGGVAMSVLEFTITASASKTATSLAQQLAETVQILAAGSNALSSYSSALKTAVSSQVYRLDNDCLMQIHCQSCVQVRVVVASPAIASHHANSVYSGARRAATHTDNGLLLFT